MIFRRNLEIWLRISIRAAENQWPRQKRGLAPTLEAVRLLRRRPERSPRRPFCNGISHLRAHAAGTSIILTRIGLDFIMSIC